MFTKDTKVVFRSDVHLPNKLAADFPGWEADNYPDFLLRIEAGERAVVTGSSSHGSFPYTRYHVRFDDGSHAYNVEPQIFQVAK